VHGDDELSASDSAPNGRESPSDVHARTPASNRTGLIERLWLAEEPATALGLCRVLLVAVFTASMLSHFGAIDEYFSASSMVFGEHARRAFPSRWSLLFYVDDPWAARAVWMVGVLAHLAWLVGYRTGISACVAVGTWISMVGRNPLLYALPDQLHTALACLLAAMPTGRALSLDARRVGSRPVPVWCRRVLQLQLAVVYVGTGVLKSGTTWQDGSALYYALVNPYNRHFDVAMALARLQPWILRPLTWMVLVWELSFAVLVTLTWARELWPSRRIVDVRVPLLGFGTAMHLGIQVMLYVLWFTPLTLAAYACFLAPHEARSIVDRAWSHVGRRYTALQRWLRTRQGDRIDVPPGSYRHGVAAEHESNRHVDLTGEPVE